jgi:hypothetical protein
VKTARHLTHVALLALVAACGAGTPPAGAPSGDGSQLATPLTTAFAEAAKGDPAKAIALYEDVLDRAAASRPDAWQVAIAGSALDALVSRSVAALSSITADAGLVYRTNDPSLTRSDTLGTEERGNDSIVARLASAYAHAEGPYVRGMIAEAMTEVAEHRGDVADAARWREATGCAREATVVGPLDWAPLTGVDRPDPLAAFDVRLAATYTGPGAFAPSLPPVVERGRGCAIDLSTESSNAGVRDVVVDVDVKKASRIGLMMRTSARATLRAGGNLVIDRPYELGGDDVTRFAWVDASAGTLRLVARVGVDQEGEGVRIAAWDDTGHPLRMRAPRPGDAATVKVTTGDPLPYPTARSHDEELTVATGALAMQDPRSTEYLLEHDATRPDAAPDLALAYARAAGEARDLSLVHRTERTRAAYERVLAVWPNAWEAMLAHAWLAGVARGPGDARFAELDDLAKSRKRAGGAGSPTLDAFELAATGRQHLWDRARAADTKLQASIGHSALLEETERVAFERAIADRVTYDCAVHPGSPRPRGSLACYNALRAKGDLRGGLEELERLRALLGGVDLFLPLTLRDALALGDRGDVERALHDMLPAEVRLSDVYGLATLDPDRGTPSHDTLDRLRPLLVTAHDAPLAIGPLWRALREDPTAPFAGVAESVVLEDRAHPFLPGAATAVLRHSERYDVSASGVVHAVIFDLRRVNGTTDVDQNAQAGAPALTGRTSLRILRRRVLKRDGTIVEPDPNPGASQGHADLAQLEAGDVVEAIYEGWSIPLETGEIGIDTVDLLPDRVAVHDATIEMHLPKGLRMTLWSHPILGTPTKEAAAGETVLRWTLHDHLARRVEDATPKMDRSVAVSMSTARWSEIGRGLREAVDARVAHDPAVLAWALSVVKDAKATSERAKVDAIVTAAGTAVKEGDPGDLSDILYGHAIGPQSTTARAILADHEGSRTWLIVRALRELGVSCEVVVAENEPFSASPDFPPHLGRFMHPLAIAHVKSDAPGSAAGATVDVPIDADVSGPPLPAGHISPELRGRFALHEDGTIARLPETSSSNERDEIDERLTVDGRGDARGTFTILLRGHEAQEISEVLERTVGDARDRSLRGIVLAWVPFANVDSLDLSSKEGSWEVALRADVTIPGYAQSEGGPPGSATWTLPGLDPIHTVYPRGSSSTLSATYATEGARESALAVSRAVQYHVHRRVDLPPGASVIRTAGPFDVKTAPLEASRRLHVTPGPNAAIEDDLTLEIPTGTIPASAYASFVRDAHRTDDAFLASSRIKLAKAAR